MIKKQSLSKNFLFQFLYQAIILVIPLILSPFLTRTLRETALGTYSYVNSIAYYFVVFANLGISKHGQRVISRCSDDEIKLRKSFWSLYSLHAVISLIVVLFYFGFVILFTKNDRTIYVIEGFYVASALFDITWLFYGLENFKSVVIKNGLEKIIECGLIFLMVRTSNDLWKYTLISALGILVGQLIMVPQAVSLVRPIRFGINELKEHIRPLVTFSIAAIAATLYTVFDKTLLGLLATKDDVAFYEYSNKIINVPKTVVSVIGAVMYPRACKMAAQGDHEGQNRYIDYSIFITAFIGFASIWGLLGISELFSDVSFGISFAKCGEIMKMLSPLVLIIGIGEIIRIQFMLPNGMEKQFNISIICSAIINLCISSLLIPLVGIYGAIIGTISAELFGLAYQMFLCKKYIKLGTILLNTIPFVIIGCMMYFAIILVRGLVAYNVMGLLVEITVAMIVYSVLTLIYVIVFRKDIVDMIMSKLKMK